MKKILRVLIVAAFSFFLVAGTAIATPIIDFGDGLLADGGVLTLLPGGNESGTDIPIGVVSITGAPLNNGVYLVQDGNLNFNTVSHVVTVSGAIPTLGTGISFQTLLNGTISTFKIGSQIGPNSNAADFQASGADTKAADLLAAIGLDSNTAFDFFGFSLAGQPIVGTPALSWEATSTDFRNTAVPEPASILLLGLGLLGIGIASRKK